MGLKREGKPGSYQSVVEEIERLLAEGQLAPGDLLLPERQLAEALGVSRTAVREGLTALASRGVVGFGPAGAFVREVSFEEIFRPLLASSVLTKDGVGHLLEVRKVLEAESARLAALRAENERLRRLRQDLARMDEAVQSDDVHQVDTDFHVHVAEASENPLLAGITKGIFAVLGESYKPSREEMVSDTLRKQAFVEQHRAILEAIEARDSEGARAAMYVHLALVEREIGAF